MLSKIKIVLVAFCVLFGVSQAFGGEDLKPVNVVVSLVDKNQWDTARLQVYAIQKSLKDNEKADIELVMGGDSVLLFGLNDKLGKRARAEMLELLKSPNVRIVACSGAMRRANITKESLIKGVEQVPNAPREIVDRQLQGYAILNQ